MSTVITSTTPPVLFLGDDATGWMLERQPEGSIHWTAFARMGTVVLERFIEIPKSCLNR